MYKFSHSTGENRLLHITLEELNRQRAKAGASTTNTVYNSRIAEANAARQSQPTRSTGTAVTNPAAASMQRLRQTQEYLTENPTVDPTGSINTQALAGQKLAEGYVAPRNLGNEQYYSDQAKFLQGATATYNNQSGGFASEAIDGQVQTASMAGIQQSAIDRLRKEGKTDEEIKATLADPVYMENIRTTMSNTGLDGTARQSAVLTPAQAQSVLATSRNSKERAAAQAALDAAATSGISKTMEKFVGTDKDGNAIHQTVTNPNYERELEAKKQRMAQEYTNTLKVQENTKKMKEFTAGIDTSAFETTKNQINEAMGMIKNLSPDLQSAVLPALLSLQESNARISEAALKMANTLPTDQEIESQYGSFEAYISKIDGEMKRMNEENKKLQLDVATYNRDALEIDKQIIEHDAYVAEQKQLQANLENEKRLRRQLGKLGLNTDVQGLNFLQSEIQKGTDAYNDLKKGNNLLSLKAQLAIGQGYALDVRKATSDYDAQNLKITSQTAEALMKVKQSISTAKSDRDKELRSILEKSLEKKDANDKEARTTIYNANIKMIDEVNKSRDDQRAQTKENKDNAYQMFNFAFTNSVDPAMRKAAVEQMRSAGYNLPSNIDYTKLTPDQQIKMLDLAEKQKRSISSLNPADFEGEAKNIAMMAANVQLNLTDSDKGVFAQSHAPLIASLLHQGKTEEAKRVIFDAAVTNLSQSRKDVADRRGLISWVDHTIQKLEAAESLPGFYTTQWNDAKRFFGSQKDPAFRDLSSVVALASVESLHELYGSALTANELETARQILPLRGSNMNDAIQQLKNFREWQNNKQIEIVNGISGGGAFGPGSTMPSSNAPTNSGMQNILNGGDETSMETTTINNRTISARPSVIAALTRTNEAMIADGLDGIDVISSLRTREQQQVAHDRFQRGEIARAAKPGTSLHEKGLAFDIRNWKQAEKYLKAQGFNPLPADIRSSDPGHFSFLYIG